MLLTVDELAKELQVSPSTLYAWAKQGKIPCCTPNGIVRFDPEEIEIMSNVGYAAFWE